MHIDADTSAPNKLISPKHMINIRIGVIFRISGLP